MKTLRKIVAGFLSALMAFGAWGSTASAASYGTLSMDTVSYVMAPGDIYDFRAKVAGGDLRQEEVVVSDSRTGSIVQLSRVAGTDKYRIKAVNEGICWVMAEVRGVHASITVEVKNGVEQHGVATRSVTQVPLNGAGSTATGGTTSGSAVGLNENYAQQVFEKLNEVRTSQYGGKAFAWNDALSDAADIRVQELVSKFNYIRPNGSTAEDDFGSLGCTGEMFSKTKDLNEIYTFWWTTEGSKSSIRAPGVRSVAISCYVAPDGYLYTCILLSNLDENGDDGIADYYEPNPDLQPGYHEEIALEVFNLTNQERKKAGMELLQWDEELSEYAEVRAEEISRVFSHQRPDGSYDTVRENILMTYIDSAEKMVKQWMDSEGHRAAIFDRDYTKMAVGVYVREDGAIYCSQLFR